jgi:hypothetical protein
MAGGPGRDGFRGFGGVPALLVTGGTERVCVLLLKAKLWAEVRLAGEIEQLERGGWMVVFPV